MKILHTADWHLGRIFFETYLTDDQAYCLEQIVSFARENNPDVILVSGDIYDRAVPPPDAIKLLDETLHRLVTDVHCKIVIIAGNHDSPERLAFGSRIFASQGIHIYGTMEKEIPPLILEDNWGPVYFYPVPYTEPPKIKALFEDDSIRSHHGAFEAITRLILRGHPPSVRSVLCAHATVLGCDISDSERPLSIGGTETVGTELLEQFTFTALGHLHRAQTTGQKVHYSGSLMKYSFAEVTHSKSFSIIEIGKTGDVHIERIPLTPRHDLKILEGTLEDIVSGKNGFSCKSDYYMVSLTDKEPQLDAMGKLRRVYPNVLHIERPELFKMQSSSTSIPDHRKLSECDLFKAFYQQTTGDHMSSEQEACLQDLVEAINSRAREAE
jgi:exonuclease SbcD